MVDWTTELPQAPGYYWVRLPGHKHELDVEQIQDLGDGLMAYDKQGREWRALEDVWGGSGASWFGGMEPPD
jgi:hypothetical protein